MTRGHKGQAPSSLLWIRAANYLGVDLFDLLARDDGRWWCNEALSLMRIEADVQEAQSKRNHGKGYGRR